MPIKKSAIKSLRKEKKATTKNRGVKTAIKKMMKAGAKAIENKKFDEANALAQKLAKTVDKAAQRSIIKKNRANRIKSRFTKKIQKAAGK